ncbi:MAG: hypothetical protein ACNA8L_10405 [Luteolibacter sp.]
MNQLAHLRLQLLTLTEDLGAASMHLREAETLPPDLARDSVNDALEAILNISSDLAIVDTALNRHLEEMPL